MNLRACLIAPAIIFASCDSRSVEPEPASITGRWNGSEYFANTQTVRNDHYTFTATGEFTLESDHRLRGGITLFYKMFGSYRVEADRVYVKPDSTAGWDDILPQPRPTWNHAPGPFMDPARYTISGDVLTLRYMSSTNGMPSEVIVNLSRGN
jgi:hypothetical protein